MIQRFFQHLCLPALLSLALFAAFCTAPALANPEAAAPAAHSHSEPAAHAAHEGLPQAAPLLIDTPYFQFSSSTLIIWVVALGLILWARLATRRMRDVPEGAQNFWEWLVETLHTFLSGILGPQRVDKMFWFFASVFIFILALNWVSLIPGVGSVGWGVPDESGALTHISRPLLRGGNADLNMTLCMSLAFFALWIFWAVRENGVVGVFHHLFAPKGHFTGVLRWLMVVIFLFVGGLEVVSIFVRPVALTFRLYGNIFAGENVLETMTAMGGVTFGWLLAIPFYLMELLVGLVQALVFMLLTAVFTLLIMPSEEGH